MTTKGEKELSDETAEMVSNIATSAFEAAMDVFQNIKSQRHPDDRDRQHWNDEEIAAAIGSGVVAGIVFIEYHRNVGLEERIRFLLGGVTDASLDNEEDRERVVSALAKGLSDGTSGS